MTSDLTDLPDDAFLTAFLACQLPAGAFNHRNHLRVAWLHLRRFPLEEAIERTCAGIAHYAAHLNATDRYHRTLTEALIRIMSNAGASDTSLSFADFLALNPALTGDCRALIAAHYSPELLSRPEARYNFVAPDRHPLPT
jgi:N-formylglutamate deformylase